MGSPIILSYKYRYNYHMCYRFCKPSIMKTNLGGLGGSLEMPWGSLGSSRNRGEVPGGSLGRPWDIDVLHFLSCFIGKSEHWLSPRVRDVCSYCLLAPLNSFDVHQNSSCFIGKSETIWNYVFLMIAKVATGKPPKSLLPIKQPSKWWKWRVSRGAPRGHWGPLSQKTL